MPTYNNCPASEQVYCLNGGDCFFLPEDPTTYVCSCFMPYYGPRCEHVAPRPEPVAAVQNTIPSENLDPEAKRSVDRALTIAALAFIVITFLGLLVLAWYLSTRRRRDHARWKKKTVRLKSSEQRETVEFGVQVELAVSKLKHSGSFSCFSHSFNSTDLETVKRSSVNSNYLVPIANTKLTEPEDFESTYRDQISGDASNCMGIRRNPPQPDGQSFSPIAVRNSTASAAVLTTKYAIGDVQPMGVDNRHGKFVPTNHQFVNPTRLDQITEVNGTSEANRLTDTPAFMVGPIQKSAPDVKTGDSLGQRRHNKFPPDWRNLITRTFGGEKPISRNPINPSNLPPFTFSQIGLKVLPPLDSSLSPYVNAREIQSVFPSTEQFGQLCHFNSLNRRAPKHLSCCQNEPPVAHAHSLPRHFAVASQHDALLSELLHRGDEPLVQSDQPVNANSVD